MSQIAISEARTRLPELVKKAEKNLERFLITVNGKPKAAVLSLEELEALEETADILSIPGALEEIREGLKDARKRKGAALKELS